MNPSQALRAERTGLTAEATILGTLRGRGYQEYVPPRRTTTTIATIQHPLGLIELDQAPPRHVVRQCLVGTTIYGTPALADFVITGAPHWPRGLAIESKWQYAPGSVDEKLPFLVFSIQRGYSLPTIIVADGGGHRAEALAWLRRQVDGAQLCGVFSIVEFLTWANRTL